MHDPAFRVERPEGSSAFFFTCDHASRQLPDRLGTLGLPDAELGRHIAWDLGIAGVASRLSRYLDACLVAGGYSRLAIDLNRPLGTPDSIVEQSDGTVIPGNLEIPPAERERRARELFHPYHDRIRELLDRRLRAGQRTVLVSLHSFTPSMAGAARPWHAGVLYLRDTRLGHLVLELLRQQPGLTVGDNQPYAASDATDYTIVEHGERRSLPHVELELRQDLIADEAGQSAWAERLAAVLARADQIMFPP